MVGEQLIVGITETQAKTIRKARWWIGDCWRIVFGHHLSLGRTSPSAMSRRKSPRVVAKIICGGAVRQMTMTASRKVRARPMSRTATRFPTGSGRDQERRSKARIKRQTKWVWRRFKFARSVGRWVVVIARSPIRRAVRRFAGIRANRSGRRCVRGTLRRRITRSAIGCFCSWAARAAVART